MKKFIALSFMLMIASCNINAQSKKGSIQFDYSLANTLHYDQPVNLNICRDFCFAESQQAEISQNINLSYYRTLKLKHEAVVKLGGFAYKYSEKGFTSPGDNASIPYTKNIESRYFYLGLGHRWTFAQSESLRGYFENSLLYERLQEGEFFMKKYGLAVQSQLGLAVALGKSLELHSSLFYKTGFTQYDNHPYSTQKYVPYGYGVTFGVSLKV